MADLRAQLQEGLGGSYALERELGRRGMTTLRERYAIERWTE